MRTSAGSGRSAGSGGGCILLDKVLMALDTARLNRRSIGPEGALVKAREECR